MEAVGRASGDGVRLGDRDGDAVLAQERRARQAADAGADDHDVHLVGEFVGDPSGAFHRRDGGGGGRRAGREGRARAGEGVGVTTRGGNATVDGTRATVAWGGARDGAGASRRVRAVRERGHDGESTGVAPRRVPGGMWHSERWAPRWPITKPARHSRDSANASRGGRSVTPPMCRAR